MWLTAETTTQDPPVKKKVATPTAASATKTTTTKSATTKSATAKSAAKTKSATTRKSTAIRSRSTTHAASSTHVAAAAHVAPVAADVKVPVTNAALVTPARKATGTRRILTRVLRGPWRAPNFADSTEGDNVDGEDLVVRWAAVAALGPLNGTIVVTEPTSGRILSIVNQKLAFQDGFEPCSTIKVPVALAALSQNVIERNTLIRLYGRTAMALTEALARSNNQFFASLGRSSALSE